MMGQTRFFAATRAQRRQTNDPRPSLEERYDGKDAYLRAVSAEAQRLVAERYVLEEDVPMIVENASQRWDAAQAAGVT